ncbi:MAG: BTAD domain-containing putative transcriptional regulator, partial [Deferrisomatales bacterium]
ATELPVKFLAPRLDPGRHLFRTRKAKPVAARWGRGRAVLCIEAPAGQGKSVFAAQVLRCAGIATGWYQVGEEDRDPLAFASSVLSLLGSRLPGFRSPILEARLARGEVAPDDLPEAAAALAGQLRTHLRGEFCLVFDDLHRLGDSRDTASFLAALVAAEVPGLRFALVSREPLLHLAPGVRAVAVGAGDLRFSPREVAELFHGVLGETTAADAVKALHRATEGWIMGLLLLRESTAWPSEEPLSADRAGLVRYFAEQVLGVLPPDARRALLRLSLLSAIPVSLAQAVGGVDDAGRWLRDLEARNFFLRPARDDRTEYVLHPLFQECLRAEAARELGDGGVQETLGRAGRWHRDQGNGEEALRCLVAAGEHGEAEALLREVGFELLARQRAVTLKELLGGLTPAAVRRSPWLALFAGVAHLGTASPEGVSLLRGAAAGFRAAGEAGGELLALAHLLYFCVLLAADFEGAHPLLERAKQLFPAASDDGPPSARIHAAHMIATGEAFIRCDAAAAEHYSALALRWAAEGDQVNLLAGVRVARLSSGILAGAPRPPLEEAEAASRLLAHPRVSLVFRSTLMGLLVNRLLVDGDLANYRYHRDRIARVFGTEWLDARLVGPLLRLWDLHAAVVQGHWDAAEAQALGGAPAAAWAANPHVRSLFLQYAAVVHAVRGRGDRAAAAAGESRDLRRAVGGAFFAAQNDLLVGAAFARLGDRERAEAHLAACLASCETLGQAGLAAAAYCHRAALRLWDGDPKGAAGDLHALLRGLKAGVHPLAYGAWPEVLEAALAGAVAQGLEPARCRRAAADLLGVAVRPDGSTAPLVQIRTLGGLELIGADGGRLAAEDLSDVQRRFLGALLDREELAATQAEVQLALWPDSSGTRARASFNTTLSRLRRTLDEALGGRSAVDLLPLRNGVLRLAHCRVDAAEFHRQAAAGLAHARRGETWAAANRLRSAEAMWLGPFLAGLPLHDRAEQYRHRTLLVYLDVARELGRLLAGAGEVGEGLGVVNRGLAEEPTDAGLVRTLHDLHLRREDPRRAQEAVDRYARALGAAGYTPSQVDAAVNGLWTAAA